ncbi:MAG TPA: hypothetical protein VLV48_00830, partial [Thermoanaerobaculia bacterium]|nr:hypothetical protein [Thermoanaerobaculia bacterium]
PALEVGGMGQVFLQPDGRLSRLVVVPPEDSGPRGAASPDWAPMFEAAGLDAARATESAPRWRPPVGSDRRFAWTIVPEGWSEPVRVEAASLAGRPVWFEVFAPWKRAVQPISATTRPLDRLFDLIFMVALVGTLAIGAFLANRNLRRGRGNRQGAWRLALLVGSMALVSEAFMKDHFAGAGLETGVIFSAVSSSVFIAATIWVWYLALEPYLRRRWPKTLISWNRILQGRGLDPLVGRDILLGVLAGASIRLAQFIALAAPSWLGWKPPVPADSTFLELTSWKYTLGYAFRNPSFAIGIALAWMVVLLIAHLIFRQRWIAIAVVVLVVASIFPGENYPLLEWPLRLLVATVVAAVMARFGLVALVTTMYVTSMYDNFPITLDPTVWYFGQSLLALALVIGLAVFGFVRAMGQHAVFGAPVLED